MITLNRDAWESLQGVANDVGGSLRYTYSGRGMYGATCIALVASNVGTLVQFVQAVTRELEVSDLLEEFEAVLSDVASDDMGRDVVFYWPSVKVEV